GYMATVFDTSICIIEVDGQDVELELSDTAGLAAYDRLRPRSYPDTHLCMICFFHRLSRLPEKRRRQIHHSYESPIILVGLKKDLRHESKGIDELQKPDQKQVTPEQVCFPRFLTLSALILTFQTRGTQSRKKILADAYFECSAKINEGVHEVFEAAARLALAAGKKEKVGGLRRLFGR
ncbi:GTP-binding protein, partial [Lachnellula subtilissima]